ncbi:amidohydrolase family protein [Pirellulales bacterium]|nr:amidohydrolase family protein [Pirellulales bacterium]
MKRLTFTLVFILTLTPALQAQVAVRGETIHTMAGPAIENGVVLIRAGKIAAIGAADVLEIPDGFAVLEAKVVTPGLIDAHSTVGLSGIYNVAHDQDQIEHSSPIQPELRAIDAYNSREELIEWVRGFGVTTLHTGHAPGELISGQTMVVKTIDAGVEQATLIESCAVAATLGGEALKGDKQSPGTRAKMMSMLRSQLIKAQEFRDNAAKAKTANEDDEVETGNNGDDHGSEATDGQDNGGANVDKDNGGEEETDEVDSGPARDLRLETLVKLLDGELPLLVTANRAHDIAGALRLAAEFELRIWLDGGAEAYLLIDELRAADVPVFIHPLMARPIGDMKNMSFETPALLVEAGIPVVFQSGYESYVPKTRVVLFEAALAAANGLSFEQALAGITREPARLLGVADRVGTLEVGKDGDVALFDGDPFEYSTHCTGVVIDGQVVSDAVR